MIVILVCVCVCLYLGGAQRFGEGLPARALPLPLVRHLWLCVVVVHTVHTELPERRQEPQRGEPHTAHGHAHITHSLPRVPRLWRVVTPTYTTQNAPHTVD